MSLEADILGAFESHSPDEIRAALKAGQSPVALIKGKTPIDCLIEMYLRSSKFRDCLELMLNAGATIDDPVLKAVLLDDAATLLRLTKAPGFRPNRKFNPHPICLAIGLLRCLPPQYPPHSDLLHPVHRYREVKGSLLPHSGSQTSRKTGPA